MARGRRASPKQKSAGRHNLVKANVSRLGTRGTVRSRKPKGY